MLALQVRTLVDAIISGSVDVDGTNKTLTRVILVCLINPSTAGTCSAVLAMSSMHQGSVIYAIETCDTVQCSLCQVLIKYYCDLCYSKG